MPKTSVDLIESVVGFFDLAISFSEDAEAYSEHISRMSRYLGLRCYDYRLYSDVQYGIDIFDIMDFVYSTTPRVVVLNSPNYRSTKPTQFEFDVISREAQRLDISVFELGGASFKLDASILRQFVEVTDATILEVTRPSE